MKNCFICLLLLSLCIIVASRCPDSQFDDWKEYSGYCYFFSERSTSWQAAKDTCAGDGGYLADILSKEENDWISRRLNTYNDELHYYIGATDRQHEGDFVWENSGDALQYTNWREGEPNQWEGYPENCVEMKVEDGQWNDVPCDDILRFICKLPVTRK
ncbi:lectin BRA-3-like [Argopecten irradians]|uniref:lectin BRA-3-like n=1 Tax=Argopecten irradians TaxID=31199 RepID=UPI00371520E6